MSEILLVEDSPDIVSAVTAVLTSDGHRVSSVSTLAEASQALSQITPDLVLLDIELPDGDGVEFFARVAEVLEAKGIGVILLTGTNTTSLRTRSFELGALDYIAKPFDLAEFHARVNAKLKQIQKQSLHRQANGSVFANTDRRIETATSTENGAGQHDLREMGRMRSGRIELDMIRQQVFELGESDAKKQIDLTPVEFRLLLLFMQNVGSVVPRTLILDTVWGQAHVSSRCVDHHVCGLRKKIGNAGQKIESIYGVGYKIEAA